VKAEKGKKKGHANPHLLHGGGIGKGGTADYPSVSSRNGTRMERLRQLILKNGTLKREIQKRWGKNKKKKRKK